MKPYTLSTFGILLILFALSPFLCKAYIDAGFQKGLEELQYHNVTPDDINAWWNKTLEERLENQPRVFPICIAEDPIHGWPAAVKLLGDYFNTTLNRITYFEKEKHTWLHGPGRFLRGIDLYKMDQTLPSTMESTAMDQWVAILLNVATEMRGIYIQSIGGPLGIPVGEFVDIHCTRGSTIPAALTRYKNIVPCSFSPRVSETNPNVVVMDYRKYTRRLTRLVIPFKWSEAQCQEMGYLQFIIIATRDFAGDFETVLSPIFRFSDLVSGTGLPTPHHVDYDNINCVQFGGTPPFTKVDDGTTRIIPNKEYDDCIRSGTGRGATEIDKGTCPPGHFTCDTMWKTKSEWKKYIDKYWEMFIRRNYSFQDCCEIGPIGPPPITTPRPTPTPTNPTEIGNMSSTSEIPLTSAQIQKQNFVKADKALGNKTRRNEKIHQVTHGDLCILVWLVLIPMSDHISRFLKDLPDFESIGLGFWIIAHIGLHSGGVILVWLSFGLVVGSGDDKLGNVGVRHFLLGFICTTIQHVQFVTGLKRNLRERESFYYVLSHSLSGYISHFFGLVDVALSNAGTERKWLSVGFFLVWLSCTVASYYVEKVQDRRIGMSFHRPQCPVLQRVMMEEGRKPPLMRVKLAILAFMVVSQLGMFTVMMVYYEASATVDRKIQELRSRVN